MTDGGIADLNTLFHWLVLYRRTGQRSIARVFGENCADSAIVRATQRLGAFDSSPTERLHEYAANRIVGWVAAPVLVQGSIHCGARRRPYMQAQMRKDLGDRGEHFDEGDDIEFALTVRARFYIDIEDAF